MIRSASSPPHSNPPMFPAPRPLLHHQAAAATHPALAALRARKANPEGSSSGVGPVAESSWELVAGIVYPKAAEAFLSTAGCPPCVTVTSADGTEPRQGVAAARAAGAWAAVEAAAAMTTKPRAQGGTRPLLASSGSSHSFGSAGTEEDSHGEARGVGDVPSGTDESQGPGGSAAAVCRCYKGGGGGGDVSEEGGGGAGQKGTLSSLSVTRVAGAAVVAEAVEAGRRHDPWGALEALRPATLPTRQERNTGGGEGDSIDDGGAGEGGRGCQGGGALEDTGGVDPVGAVLLLCEALGCEGRLAIEVSARLDQCCGWILDHLAALFPSWVEAAAVASAGTGPASKDIILGEGVATALCAEAAAALGLFVIRRALRGEFEEAQVRPREPPTPWRRVAGAVVCSRTWAWWAGGWVGGWVREWVCTWVGGSLRR